MGHLEFTDNELTELVKFLARMSKKEGVSLKGDRLWRRVKEKENTRYPWARRHSDTSWRNKYTKRQGEFDRAVRKYNKTGYVDLVPLRNTVVRTQLGSSNSTGNQKRKHMHEPENVDDEEEEEEVPVKRPRQHSTVQSKSQKDRQSVYSSRTAAVLASRGNDSSSTENQAGSSSKGRDGKRTPMLQQGSRVPSVHVIETPDDHPVHAQSRPPDSFASQAPRPPPSPALSTGAAAQTALPAKQSKISPQPIRSGGIVSTNSATIMSPSNLSAGPSTDKRAPNSKPLFHSSTPTPSLSGGELMADRTPSPATSILRSGLRSPVRIQSSRATPSPNGPTNSHDRLRLPSRGSQPAHDEVRSEASQDNRQSAYPPSDIDMLDSDSREVSQGAEAYASAFRDSFHRDGRLSYSDFGRLTTGDLHGPTASPPISTNPGISSYGYLSPLRMNSRGPLPPLDLDGEDEVEDELALEGEEEAVHSDLPHEEPSHNALRESEDIHGTMVANAVEGDEDTGAKTPVPSVSQPQHQATEEGGSLITGGELPLENEELPNLMERMEPSAESPARVPPLQSSTVSPSYILPLNNTTAIINDESPQSSSSTPLDLQPATAGGLTAPEDNTPPETPPRPKSKTQKLIDANSNTLQPLITFEIGPGELTRDSESPPLSHPTFPPQESQPSSPPSFQPHHATTPPSPTPQEQAYASPPASSAAPTSPSPAILRKPRHTEPAIHFQPLGSSSPPAHASPPPNQHPTTLVRKPLEPSAGPSFRKVKPLMKEKLGLRRRATYGGAEVKDNLGPTVKLDLRAELLRLQASRRTPTYLDPKITWPERVPGEESSTPARPSSTRRRSALNNRLSTTLRPRASPGEIPRRRQSQIGLPDSPGAGHDEQNDAWELDETASISWLSEVDRQRITQEGIRKVLQDMEEHYGFSKRTVWNIWDVEKSLERVEEVLQRMRRAAQGVIDMELGNLEEG